MVINQVMDSLVLYMVRAELGQLRQEPIWEGLTVHFLNDIGHARLVFGKERFLEVVAKLILKQVSYESFAKHCC